MLHMAFPWPLDRWGRLVAPEAEVGAFLRIEKESGEGWKVPPPDDAYRLWHARPGSVQDDDYSNWTVWLASRDDVARWFTESHLVVAEWLPEGQEPDWAWAG